MSDPKKSPKRLKYPDGTFKLMRVTNSALHMLWKMSLEYHINVTIIFFWHICYARKFLKSGRVVS